MKCRACAQVIPPGFGVQLGRRHAFCNKTCRADWAVERVLQLESAMTSIHVHCRGKARKLAIDTLIGNIAPAEADG